ncbi:MAG: glycoside hydrolase family 43 protein [Bacteroidota bacterium]
MLKNKLPLCWQVCLAFVWLLSFSLKAQNLSNPISDLADPFITYYEGNYYLTGTTGGNVAIRRSPTLDGLKRAPLTEIFARDPNNRNHPCCNYWAPEIHRINGRWYAYFTAGTNGNLDSQRNFVLEGGTGDPFSAPWRFIAQIKDSEDWAIDGTVLQLNGANYFVWSSGDFGQSIVIARMSNPWTITGRRVIISQPNVPQTTGWENDRPLNEGPSVLQHNGRTFIAFSGSGCETPNYALGLLTLNNPNDPL